MRITTKKGREFAFKLRAIRNARTGQKKWFVGITTKEYFWLDLSNEHIETARYLALILRNRLKTTVYIFQTTKSFWLVTKKKLFGKAWDKEYEHWLKVPKGLVCHAFCECCIRYHKATLRVSAKHGKRPMLVEVIKRLESDFGGSPLTPRLRHLSLRLDQRHSLHTRPKGYINSSSVASKSRVKVQEVTQGRANRCPSCATRFGKAQN